MTKKAHIEHMNVGRDVEGAITNHMVMFRTKTGEKQLAEGPKIKNKQKTKIRLVLPIDLIF